MNRIYLHTTRGICPVCREVVDAKVFAENNRVYIEKYCLSHGRNSALISSDETYYRQSHRYIKPGRLPAASFAERVSGCPDDCGLCPDHEQHICMPVLEITGRCSLNCPICIAHEEDRPDLTLDQIRFMMDRLLSAEGTIDVLNVSGGEPMMHPHYREIMTYLTSLEAVTKISVSTNGLALLDDDDLIKFHKDQGVIVSLQLDGCGPSVYPGLRGRDLRAEKQRIVEGLLRHDLDFTLITTLARGINDTREDMMFLYDLCMEHANILSWMIQPLVYRKDRENEVNVMDRITIPDAIRLVSEASRGKIRTDDFMPLPCCNANCFSLVHLLQYEDGAYLPIKRFVQQQRYIETIQNRSFFGADEESFEGIKDIIFSIWTDAEDLSPELRESTAKALKSIRGIIKDIQRANEGCGCHSAKRTFDTASRKIKSIYIHHFMDADTFDLTRVRRCCTIYPKPDGKFYPMCTYNNLYRKKQRRKAPGNVV